MIDEKMPISLIFISNFPKELIFESNNLFQVSEVKDDNSAFEKLSNNIDQNKLYNVILSGHNTTEDAYGLLKSFLDYNINNGYCFDNSNYPFFLFIENEKFNKKDLYAYYIEQEKERKDLEVGLMIDSKIILFSNISCNVKEKLNNILNYYHRKDVEVKINPYFSPFIKIMYIGVTGTGKSTMINEFNGEKISYSSSENQMKTRIQKNRQLIFKNKKYPILNQDTEGFEIADNSQIEKVNNNINKNEGYNFDERLHIVIYLVKNERGLDNNDIPLLMKLHNMKILYYVLWPRNEGKDQILKGKANRLINDLISKLKNNDDSTKKLFNEFDDKTILPKILKQIAEKLKDRIFSADILSKDSIGKFNLLDRIKKDLLEIYKIHEKYMKIIENFQDKNEKFKISISGKILEKEENNYIQILDDSPFFYKFNIDDIKRQEAEKLLKDCDVSWTWLFFYNTRVESLRKSMLAKIKNIYSEVKIDAQVDEKQFSDEESVFYKTKTTKEFIKELIKFFAEKYKKLELSKKYYSSCKEYNKSIKEFEKYVDDFKNMKLNKESVRYDIDFI